MNQLGTGLLAGGRKTGTALVLAAACQTACGSAGREIDLCGTREKGPAVLHGPGAEQNASRVAAAWAKATNRFSWKSREPGLRVWRSMVQNPLPVSDSRRVATASSSAAVATC